MSDVGENALIIKNMYGTSKYCVAYPATELCVQPEGMRTLTCVDTVYSIIVVAKT